MFQLLVILFLIKLFAQEVILKHQLFSYQSYKHNLAQMPSLNLTPKLSFEPRFCMLTINVYYIKSKCL